MGQGVGTTLCIGSTTVIVGFGSWALDVHDIPSFSRKMRQLMKRTPIHPQFVLDSRADHAFDREWDQLWEEGRKIDSDRAEAKRLKRERAKQKTEVL